MKRYFAAVMLFTAIFVTVTNVHLYPDHLAFPEAETERINPLWKRRLLYGHFPRPQIPPEVSRNWDVL
jgi:hypothetical protein